MRKPFAHEAVLTMAADADTRAPGAAITAALCGHWKHEPPCPLSPHHSRAEWVGSEVHVQILFAAEREMEGDVRHRIDQALVGGRLQGPNGVTTQWQLHGSSLHSAVLEQEADHAQRLTRLSTFGCCLSERVSRASTRGRGH